MEFLSGGFAVLERDVASVLGREGRYGLSSTLARFGETEWACSVGVAILD